MSSIHKAVLLNEVVENLISDKGIIRGETPWYLDGTLGGAGHALSVSQRLRGKLNIIAFDRDPEAINRARTVLNGRCERLVLANDNFRNMDKWLQKEGISSLDYVLLDLGLSSDELENSGRGFTFMKDEPVHMTMGMPEQHAFTAKDILNDWEENDIANVIYAYGEEIYARRIARAIVQYRQKKRIDTTYELKEIVYSAVPAVYRRRKIHPATKTFQALRIAVNDELKSLEIGLSKSFEYLKNGGRLAVISFHSLEDRMVKNFMKSLAPEHATLINKKPIVASDEEIEANPRARSAKLRVIEKIFK